MVATLRLFRPETAETAETARRNKHSFRKGSPGGDFMG